MCIAVAGLVTEINEDYAKVDVSGNMIDANIKLVNPKEIGRAHV